MSQVKKLIHMMQRQWVSTMDAFNEGITSYHRRLSDFREQYPHIGKGRLIDGKYYHLELRQRPIETRWGEAKITEYRLKRAK